MLTPGVAGSVTMMITNALAVNFDAPRAMTGLVISFVCGLLVLAAVKDVLVKVVLYVLNSLVIFCVAIGANGIAVTGARHALGPIVGSAYASGPNISSEVQLALRCVDIGSSVEAAQKRGARNDDILRLLQPCQALSREILDKNPFPVPRSSPDPAPLARAPQGIPMAWKSKSSSFFAPWTF
jgi:hypothetical protein